MPLNYERILAYRPGPLDASYDERRCMLYALGIGIGMDPLDREQIKFVHERELEAFPTMVTTLGWMGRLMDPAFGIDTKMVVAASLKVTLHRPLQTHDTLTSDPRVVEIIDKGPGKHAIIQSARNLVATDGTVVATVENDAIARGHGGPMTSAICRRRPTSP
jgi:MFE-2 hydratase 2 N-terminal domain